tara:strand:- start:64 stop:237 length:174 start_codon:yes stop_codon:yes gene_type:complete
MSRLSSGDVSPTPTLVTEKGKKMGHRTLVVHSEYFPAQPIFLPAGDPAFGGRGGIMS